MTQDAVKALSDGELVQVVAWAQAEQKERAERHKRETLMKIRELAQSIEVEIKIKGKHGRAATSARRPGRLRKLN